MNVPGNPTEGRMQIGDDLMDRLFGDRPDGHTMVIRAEPGCRPDMVPIGRGDLLPVGPGVRKSAGAPNKNKAAQKARRAARGKNRG